MFDDESAGTVIPEFVNMTFDVAIFDEPHRCDRTTRRASNGAGNWSSLATRNVSRPRTFRTIRPATNTATTMRHAADFELVSPGAVTGINQKRLKWHYVAREDSSLSPTNISTMRLVTFPSGVTGPAIRFERRRWAIHHCVNVAESRRTAELGHGLFRKT